MLYQFLGKPDNIFPTLVTNRIYDLKVNQNNKTGKVYIINPFYCPYSNLKTFFKNWKPIIN